MGQNTLPNQGVVKRDWVATGRIDFATRLNGDAADADQPNEFKLLVEERRIVESIAGNENLEIQWRLATLKEAKWQDLKSRLLPIEILQIFEGRFQFCVLALCTRIKTSRTVTHHKHFYSPKADTRHWRSPKHGNPDAVKGVVV